MADIIRCSSEELRAYIREAEANAVRKFVEDANVRVRGQTSYYSTCRFQLIATSPAPGTYNVTLSQAERQPFAYSLGQSPAVAGFVAPTGMPTSAAAAATLTQTNLSQPKSTRNGERFIITGISAFLSEGSDSALAAWVWQHANVQLVKNDTTRSPLGPLAFFPALSSINGSGTAPNLNPSFAESLATISRFRSSEGLSRSFDLSAAPVIWMPQGQTDGSLFLAVNLDEPYTDSAADRAAVPGTINAWTPAYAANSTPLGPNPTPSQVATGSYVDILFRLDGTSEAIMSQNQGT